MDTGLDIVNSSIKGSVPRETEAATVLAGVVRCIGPGIRWAMACQTVDTNPKSVAAYTRPKKTIATMMALNIASLHCKRFGGLQSTLGFRMAVGFWHHPAERHCSTATQN